jgi:alpha-ketoglutarate-dependent taurine dioxygenase
MELFNALEQKGFCCLENQSYEKLQEIIDGLGKTIMITDVSVNLDSRALVTSDRALGFHTDHSKANYIVWYCLKQCDSGGETLVLDTHKILANLTSREQNILCNIHLYEHKIFDDDPESSPLLRFIDGKPQFYYSFWLADDAQRQDPTFIKFMELTESIPFENYKLQPGDVLIVDNRRMLHGRTAIEGNKDRHLKRFWIN